MITEFKTQIFAKNTPSTRLQKHLKSFVVLIKPLLAAKPSRQRQYPLRHWWLRRPGRGGDAASPPRPHRASLAPPVEELPGSPGRSLAVSKRPSVVRVCHRCQWRRARPSQGQKVWSRLLDGATAMSMGNDAEEGTA